MTCCVAPLGTQIVILSCKVTFTCATVTVALVESIFLMRPLTFASETKFESHSASSPSPRGGMSDGGLAGSNVRWVKTTGCLSMMGLAAACRLSPVEETARQASQPAMAANRNANTGQARCKKNLLIHFRRGLIGPTTALWAGLLRKALGPPSV